MCVVIWVYVCVCVCCVCLNVLCYFIRFWYPTRTNFPSHSPPAHALARRIPPHKLIEGIAPLSMPLPGRDNNNNHDDDKSVCCCCGGLLSC